MDEESDMHFVVWYQQDGKVFKTDCMNNDHMATTICRIRAAQNATNIHIDVFRNKK